MIVASTLAIIFFNTLFLIILNKNSYASKSIRSQPRIIFTTLAINDLANGLLVLGVGIFPATFQCWPFGEMLCQIQVRKKKFISTVRAQLISNHSLNRTVTAFFEAQEFFFKY